MKKLILLSILFVVGCEEYAPTEHTHDYTVEVDWILIKSSNAVEYHPETDESVLGIGYMLFITNSAGFTIDENILDSDSGVLSFLYEEESFNFNLSDSYNEEMNMYFFIVYNYNNTYPDRLILNTESNDLTFYTTWGQVVEIATARPNEIIDYR